MNVLKIMKSEGLHRESKIGQIGPYPLYVKSFESLIDNNKVSDEVMDALFHLFSMRQPDVLAINTHTLTDILEGKPRARSRYFTKRNIFENIKEIIGPYLECGNHWTFFHCSIVDHTITYLNSLGEEDEQYYKLAENWSIFAASKGYRGPWKRTKRNHTLQNDTISCGVFTAVFAEAFLGDTRGYLACSPVLQERERLGIFLFSSLDRSGICGICHRMASRKIQEKCSTCSVRIHTKCLPGNQEDARCIFCKDSAGEIIPNRTRIEGQDSSGQSNPKNTRPEEQHSLGESNTNSRHEGQDSSGVSNPNTKNEGQDTTGERNSNTRNEGQDSTGESNSNTRNEGQDSTGESNPNTRNEGRDSKGESNPNTRNEGQDSTGESNPNTRNDGQDSTGESNHNTRNEGQDSTGESNPNTRNDGQDTTGESNPNTRNDGQDSTGESNPNTRNERQDSTGESNSNTRNEGQDSTGESNPNTRNERQDTTGESNPNTRNEGQDSTEESNPNTRNEGQHSTGESNSNTRNEGQDSTGESNPNTRNEGQDSKGESNPNTRNEGQDSTGENSTGESNPNTRNEGQDSTGESNPNTRNDGQYRTGDSNPNTRNEGQDSTGESNSNTRNEGQDSTGESNPNTRNERQDTTGESNPNTRNEGQDSTEESNPNTRNEGQHSTGESFPNTTGLEEQDSIRQSAGVEGKNSTGQIQDKTGGFLVESVLKVSDFNQAKRYLVTSEELQRRCSLPECYSANTVVAYLRKAKGQKQKITEKLVELEVTPSKRTKLTSQCSKLCEDECSDLAGDLTYLAAKFIPQKKVAQALLEEGNLHTAMAKTEECRKTLKAVQNALESNWETYDLATHGLGPAVIKGTFSLIDSCLKEKMRALKSKDSTDK
ncbi:uncharacterized protein [Misgurnus anguillicaudatus]|uniref:uncharacterized protein n=1 Tax=Misgurnus anguillicaudatus TaxID=75329 RepID=UPI003CCF6004